MDELPSYLLKLFTERRVSRSQLPARSKELLHPLFDGGVLEIERGGRGEVVLVCNVEAFATWVARNFPAFGNRWQVPENASRAYALALHRDSKASGLGVSQSVLRLWASGSLESRITVDGIEFPVAELSTRHGVAAGLIGSDSRMTFEVRVALVENLECFLRMEAIIPNVPLVINSAGHI